MLKRLFRQLRLKSRQCNNMAMDASALADEIMAGLGSSDPATTQVTNMAKDIVDHVKTAVASYASGSVTGDAPSSGGPLVNGAGANGMILLVASDLVGRFSASFGQSTSEISGMATAISAHIITGTFSHSSGNITGVCTNTTSNPGILTAGTAIMGEISGLSGSAMASAIASGISQAGSTPELDGLANAIVDHIEGNAEVSFASGGITAVCGTGGGPITLGTGVGGTIL